MANSTPVEEECGSDVSSRILFPLVLQEQITTELTEIQLPKIDITWINNEYKTYSFVVSPLCIKCLPASDSFGLIYIKGAGITGSRNDILYYGIIDKSGSLLSEICVDIFTGRVSNLRMSFDITDYGDIFYCYEPSQKDIKKGLYRIGIHDSYHTSTREDCEEEVADFCFVQPNMLLCSVILRCGGKVIKKDLFTNQTIQNIEKHQNGENIFTRPGKLCANKNGDICIIDGSNSLKLIVVDKLGTKRFEYTGTGHSRFFPTNVVCDPQKRILLADLNRVHLLDENGVFIMFVVTAVHYGAGNFNIIDIDNQGRLWTNRNNCLLGIRYAESVNAALRSRSQ